MTLRLPAALGVVALSLTMVALPTAASAVVEDAVPGILIEDTAHELPAPDVSLASDGRALVVYQDGVPGSDPADPGAVCTSSGGDCSIVARIVEADGVTVGEPFLVSGDVTNNYYYAAPQAYWNDDLTEWVVIFNSYDAEPERLYAQRVDADGTLIGTLVEMPASVTTAGDRSTVLIEDTDDHVLAQLSWSSAEQAYLMTYFARDYQVNGYRIVAVALTSALVPVDGVQSAVLLSTANSNTEYQSRIATNGTTGDWLVSWANRDNDDVLVNGVRLNGTALEISDPVTVITGSTVAGMWPQGGLVWVESEDAALVTYGGQLGTAPDTRMEILGNYVSGDPFASATVASQIIVSDFGASRAGTTITEVRSHETAYDSASGSVVFAGTVRYRNADDTANMFSALTWALDPATGVASEAVDLFAPSDVPADGVIEQASRPRLDSLDGTLAVVWQNWLGGDYEEPTQVRYALLTPADAGEQPELAETGANESIALLALAGGLLVAGAMLVAVRRRASMTA